MTYQTKTSELLYADEHMRCDKYGWEDKSLIYFFDLDEGRKLEYLPKEHVMLYVKKGRVNLEWPGYKQCRQVNENEFIVLPSSQIILATIQEKARVMICRFSEEVKPCKMLKIKQNDTFFMSRDQIENNEIICANAIIKNQIDAIECCVEMGIKCQNYQNMKVSEILYMFRFFYTKEKLLAFFHSILSRDIAFKRFIYSNWNAVNSIEELAGRANCHRDTFARKFQRIMGASPGQWMREKRAEQIKHELKYSLKPLKQIAEDFDFSSPAAFNEFCKKQLNETPGRIRSQWVEKE